MCHKRHTMSSMTTARKQFMGYLDIRVPESLKKDLDAIAEEWEKDPRRGRVTRSGVARALLIEGIEKEKEAMRRR